MHCVGAAQETELGVGCGGLSRCLLRALDPRLTLSSLGDGAGQLEKAGPRIASLRQQVRRLEAELAQSRPAQARARPHP